jgi:hypothetical protein
MTAGRMAMSDYLVDRIPDGLKVLPDAGGQGRQEKRGREKRRPEGDSVTISQEARRRSDGRVDTEGDAEEAGG